MWVQKDTLRTGQEERSVVLFFLVLVQLVHDQTVNGFQLFFILNGAKDILTVFFHRLENADLQVLIFLTGRNDSQIGKAVVF